MPYQNEEIVEITCNINKYLENVDILNGDTYICIYIRKYQGDSNKGHYHCENAQSFWVINKS